MGVTAIGEKEFRDAVRSNSLIALTVLFVLLGGGLAAIQWVPEMFRGSDVDWSTLALLNSLRQPTVVLVPMIGIGLGYNVIAGERESGSIKLALGLPNSRLDLVLGKFLGRSAVAAVSILAGYGVAGAIALGTYPTFDAVAFALYTLLTVAYGAVFVAIGVGFSAAVDERPLALGGAVMLYVLFLLAWDLVMVGLQAVTVGSPMPESGLPEWVLFVGLLNPANAFNVAARAAIPEYGAITTLPESSEIFLRDWVGFVVLALWIVVPLGLGYLQLRRLDLP